MAAPAVDRIAALLAHPEADRRMAAAIVLGELGEASAKVVRALCGALTGDPLVQRHVLEALGKLGGADAAPAVVAACSARDAAVRDAALSALGHLGSAALPALKARMKEAGPEEHRALEAALARLGGKQALGALLASFDGGDDESAVAAAVAMRPQIREADARTRQSYWTELERFLERHLANPREPNSSKTPKPETKRAKSAQASAAKATGKDKAQKNGAGSSAADDAPAPSAPGAKPATGAVRAALKIAGYLEDERATTLLLRYARSDFPPAVRQEALIALRFAIAGKKADAKVVDALCPAAEDADRTLAQTALITLSGLELAPGAAGRLSALLEHPEEARASAVAELFAGRSDAASGEALVRTATHGEPRRATLAAHALTKRADAAATLSRALAEAQGSERARMLADFLRPFGHKLPQGAAEALLDTAIARLTADEPNWEAPLEVAREAAAALVAERLRELAQKLTRSKPERAAVVLRLLCKGEKSNLADRWALARVLLARSPKDVTRAARDGDEALRLLAELLRRGFDVLGALRRDKQVELDTLYYLGFHFAEEGEPAGAELLQLVVERAGRAKLGRMARNKLELVSAAGA